MRSLAEAAGMDKTTDFTHGDFDKLDFVNDGDFLAGANFRGSNLRDTKFYPSNSLARTLLEGVDLTGASGLTEQMLSEAYIDETTILPDYIDRGAVMRMHKDLNLPAPPDRNEGDGTITIEIPATFHRRQ